MLTLGLSRFGVFSRPLTNQDWELELKGSLMHKSQLPVATMPKAGGCLQILANKGDGLFPADGCEGSL